MDNVYVLHSLEELIFSISKTIRRIGDKRLETNTITFTGIHQVSICFNQSELFCRYHVINALASVTLILFLIVPTKSMPRAILESDCKTARFLRSSRASRLEKPIWKKKKDDCFAA